MDTGSEDGEPGGSTDASPLTDDERAMLDRLRHSGGRDVVGRTPEESPAAGEAAEDDAPLPDYPAPQRAAEADPLDPVFREPGP
ncbi:MAG: hypothetical protein ACJ73E_16995 [Mycobacteriales bacterium]